jgi:hypothetical protein
LVKKKSFFDRGGEICYKSSISQIFAISTRVDQVKKNFQKIFFFVKKYFFIKAIFIKNIFFCFSIVSEHDGHFIHFYLHNLKSSGGCFPSTLRGIQTKEDLKYVIDNKL